MMTLPHFNDPAITRRIEEWTSSAYDEKTRAEVSALADAGDAKELEDRFYRTLEFGTGGLRGKLGAGTNRMNAYIVARATQGLANYVKANATRPGPLRAVVGHDSRHRSREFAETVAGVLAANGFYVHISPTIRPTPYVSYAIRELQCHTGIMVTASHNPREYNGYKVYWDDGSQVIAPHDEGIIREVDKVTDDSMVLRAKFDEAVAQGLVKVMGAEMDEAYLAAVLKQRIDEPTIRAYAPRIVYTPLHGVGGTMAPEALRQWGFRDVICEPEQMKPDGDFPTAASPNPEEGAALDRAVKLAEKEGAELVLATDPDADRLGVAVLHQGKFRLMTGNQMCALVGDFLISNHKARVAPRQAGMVTTIVTSPLVKKMAEGHGAACPLVLTGFKWIADTMRKWEAAGGNPAFLYGTEESYGYLIGEHCRDKDGIVASCVVAEMAAHARKEGLTLVDKLDQLYVRHGVHYEFQKSITMPGADGARQIAAILDGIRKSPPSTIDGRPVARFARVDTGEVFAYGKPAEALDLPRSDVFLFDLEDGTRGIVRPSGTEPKIKFYFFLCDAKKPATIAEARATYDRLAQTAPAFLKEFLQAIGHQG